MEKADVSKIEKIATYFYFNEITKRLDIKKWYISSDDPLVNAI